MIMNHSNGTKNGHAARVLEGKLAIVTGASRGLGASIATQLASKGCSIVINYSSDSSTTKASALATRLQDEYSVKAITAKADIGSANGPAELVSIAREHFSSCSSDLPNNKTGGKPFQIDIIVNNAGIVLPEPVGSITLENFDAQYRINVRGPMLLVQAALPYLPTDRSGRIVNVSSIGSSIGFWYQTVYGGTKAAVEAMTRTWARELAERATVNAVNPGGIDTGMYGSLPQDMLEKLAPFNRLTPLAAVREGVDDERVVEQAKAFGGRSGYPSEVAGAVVMLCLPEAGWTTDSVVCANGGGVFTR